MHERWERHLHQLRIIIASKSRTKLPLLFPHCCNSHIFWKQSAVKLHWKPYRLRIERVHTTLKLVQQKIGSIAEIWQLIKYLYLRKCRYLCSTLQLGVNNEPVIWEVLFLLVCYITIFLYLLKWTNKISLICPIPINHTDCRSVIRNVLVKRCTQRWETCREKLRNHSCAWDVDRLGKVHTKRWSGNKWGENGRYFINPWISNPI